MAEVHKLADVAVPISVILPVLNDEPQLCHTLEQAASVLAASGLTYEIIIVAADLQHAAVPDAAGLSSVRLVSQEHGSGWGDAILTASAQAQHDLICTIDLHSLYAVPKSPACCAHWKNTMLPWLSVYVLEYKNPSPRGAEYCGGFSTCWHPTPWEDRSSTSTPAYAFFAVPHCMNSPTAFQSHPRYPPC